MSVVSSIIDHLLSEPDGDDFDTKETARDRLRHVVGRNSGWSDRTAGAARYEVARLWEAAEERIVQTAIRIGDKIYSGRLHADAVRLARRSGAFPEWRTPAEFEQAWRRDEPYQRHQWEEGFITNTGRFGDREEAADIAMVANQISEPTDSLDAGDLAEAQEELKQAARKIVEFLVADDMPVETPVCEASVHLPRRGRVWIACFTGPTGGQVWRSTATTDRNQALLVAKRLEAAARIERARAGRSIRKPNIRVRRSEPARVGPLSQREVGLLLRLSVRAVRRIECRAFEKLRQHPLLRQAWRQYLERALDERQLVLTPEEVGALFNLAYTTEERRLIQKIISLLRR